MLIVQYPMQLSEPPRNISNSCSAPLCAGRRLLLNGRRPGHS